MSEASCLPQTTLRSPAGVSPPGSLQAGISAPETCQWGAPVSSGMVAGMVALQGPTRNICSRTV